MSDTTAAADRRLRHESPTAQTVIGLARERVAPGDRERVASLAAIFLRKSQEALLRERSAEQLAAMIVGVLGFPDRYASTSR
jgi:hypothetical protein